MWDASFVHPIIIWPSQRGRASVTVKVKCLEAVKIKGNNPIKLLIIIKSKRDNGRSESPGAE